ncbi:MAG: NADP-dependent phosphogluconate dehydrogenase [Flavobacteriaceae bacterium]
MIYILYGVSGAGKTTLGTAWAKELSLPFYDADDFHPATNKAKMAAGHPLTDEDRWPWLTLLKAAFPQWEEKGGAVLACSALKEEYRSFLLGELVVPIHFYHLKVAKELLQERMSSREHFMPVTLLDSQFEALEPAQYGTEINAAASLENCLMELNQSINEKASLGLYGLGVMGKNLAINLADKGFGVAIYNRHVAGSEEKIAQKLASAQPQLPFFPTQDVNEFVASIARPRKIILMIPAGKTVDLVIDQLRPELDPGDIIIDGGNSHYQESIRRTVALKKQQLHFYGLGISGGAKGARKGPALMPSGAKNCYPQLAPIFEAIAAKDREGKACSGWIGQAGSGHFVKMIHNGIEYGEMQLIAELYHALRYHAGKTTEEIASLFEQWQAGDCASYLLEISIQIVRTKEDEKPLLDLILDKAGNKGTGNWSAKAAFELGSPFTVGSAALQARFLSAFKEEREKANGLFDLEKRTFSLEEDSLQQAYQMARIINHAEGLKVLQNASEEYGWELNLAEITRIWTNGCIIRSSLMEQWSKALIQPTTHPLFSLLNKTENAQGINALATFVQVGLGALCALPAHSAALNYALSWQREQSPANMIQAQRDFFGQHRFERKDQTGSFTHGWE